MIYLSLNLWSTTFPKKTLVSAEISVLEKMPLGGLSLCSTCFLDVLSLWSTYPPKPAEKSFLLFCSKGLVLVYDLPLFSNLIVFVLFLLTLCLFLLSSSLSLLSFFLSFFVSLPSSASLTWKQKERKKHRKAGKEEIAKERKKEEERKRWR